MSHCLSWELNGYLHPPCHICTYDACPDFAGIRSYGVASKGDLRLAKVGCKQLMAWRISLKVEKYKQLALKEKCSFARGKLGCCRPCELQLCE